MGTIMTLMSIAQEALQADQSELNVTADNVANASTPGYTRETVNLESQDTVTLGGPVFGTGVVASAPESQRDTVLEQRVQQQTQVSSQSSAVETALNQIQSVFGLTSSTASSSLTQLGTAVDGFFSSLTALASDPSSTATQQGVLSAASTLASAFNTTSSELSSTASSLNSQVSSLAGQVNPLLTQIASLNQQISEVSPTGDAGVLEDQRQEAVDQVSQLIGVDQVTTSPGNGIELTTSNGGLLVAGDQAYALSTATVSGSTQVSGGPEGTTNLTNGLTGGQIGGALSVLNTTLPQVESSLDTLAFGLGTAVNTQNEAGVLADGTTPGGALFTLGTSAPGAAGTIAVATTDPGQVASAASGEGTSGNTNATALAALANATTVTGLGGQTADEFLSSTLASVGDAASAATTDATVQSASLTQLTTQRDAISSVSLDQEASNLTEFQRSYQAASEVFSIVDSLLASAINIGVETAVS
jgi:flagellar hook-associated protein 1 FlgK